MLNIIERLCIFNCQNSINQVTMPDDPGNFTEFRDELKRRKVFSVVATSSAPSGISEKQ